MDLTNAPSDLFEWLDHGILPGEGGGETAEDVPEADVKPDVDALPGEDTDSDADPDSEADEQDAESGPGATPSEGEADPEDAPGDEEAEGESPAEPGDADSDTEAEEDVDAEADADADAAEAEAGAGDADAEATADADLDMDAEEALDQATERPEEGEADDADGPDEHLSFSLDAPSTTDEAPDEPDDSDTHEADPAEDVPFDDTIADRDERVEGYDGENDHETLRRYLRRSGVAERIQRELEDLFTGTTHTPTRAGRERPETGLVGGRPDMRQVVRRFAGDLRVRDLFEDPDPGIDDDVAVVLVLDLSGSMARGGAEHDAKAATGAFLFGIQMFGGDVAALAYPPNELITAPQESFRWEHLDAGWVSGGTPTKKAVRAGAQLLERMPDRRKLLLVLTDGGARSLSGTRATVDEIRERGDEWSVIGFGFGNIQEWQLEDQFGDGYRAVDLEELPSALVDVYSDQQRGRV